jgi:hypothetical protein
LQERLREMAYKEGKKRLEGGRGGHAMRMSRLMSQVRLTGKRRASELGNEKRRSSKCVDEQEEACECDEKQEDGARGGLGAWQQARGGLADLATSRKRAGERGWCGDEQEGVGECSNEQGEG